MNELDKVLKLLEAGYTKEEIGNFFSEEPNPTPTPAPVPDPIPIQEPAPTNNDEELKKLNALIEEQKKQIEELKGNYKNPFKGAQAETKSLKELTKELLKN